MSEADVSAFLAGVEPARRREDAQAVCAVMERLSGEPPAMWGASMVGFGRYRYRYDSGREGEAFLTGFSPRKGALTLYVTGDFPRREALLARLGKHTTGKSCVYLKSLDDVDGSVLEELIAESLAWMRATHREPA